MITTQIKKDWYIVKTDGLAFFGRNRVEVMARAFRHIEKLQVAANV